MPPDDPDILKMYELSEANAVPYSSGWGSSNSTAWRGGGDTRAPDIVMRDTPAAAAAAPWRPHPGHAPAVGLCQEVIVTQGVKPAWGAFGNGSWGQPAESRGRDSERTPQRRGHPGATQGYHRTPASYSEEHRQDRGSNGDSAHDSWSPTDHREYSRRSAEREHHRAAKRRHNEDTSEDERSNCSRSGRMNTTKSPHRSHTIGSSKQKKESGRR